MGSLYKNGRVRSYIMILLAVTALLISAPVKKAITHGVNDRINGFTKMLHDTTGLSISYEKLSPSLLSNFYIRNIRVFDDDGNQLLAISKTRVTYSIINLIRKDLQRGISSVIVDGINLVKKHVKPNRENETGGILETEAPIHISNVVVADKKETKKADKKEAKKETKKEVKETKKTSKKKEKESK